MKYHFLFFLGFFSIVQAQLRPQNGVANSIAKQIAFTNARIIVSPEKVIENGTLLIENDRIVAVGTMVRMDASAVQIDCKGNTILPAFIETNTSVGISKAFAKERGPSPQLESSKDGAYYWNEAIHPEISAEELYKFDQKSSEELIKMGFGLALTHQSDGIVQGTGALVSLVTDDKYEQLVKGKCAQFFSFEKGVSRQTYPSSQMGSIALLRQALYDLNWYRSAQPAERDLSLEAWKSTVELPVLFATKDKWEITRAAKIAREFGMSFNYVGSGNEYQSLKSLKEINGYIVLPVNFPEPYEVKDPFLARQIPLSDLKHWELAPSNPYLLKKAGASICISSAGQKNPEAFWKNVKKCMERGLSWQEVLASLTSEPAKMIRAEEELGSLEKGKRASFAIYTSDPFSDNGKLLEMWVNGNQKIIENFEAIDISGKYNILIDGKQFPMDITMEGDQPKGKLIVPNPSDSKDSSTALFVKLSGTDLTIQFISKDNNWKGSVNLHGKINEKLGVFEGDGTLPDGRWIKWSAIRNGAIDKTEKKNAVVDSSYTTSIWSPNMAYGFSLDPKVETIVFKDANIWTNESTGVLKDASVVIQNGQITFVGADSYAIPNGAKVIDAKGKHLTCGIIDEHSHIAISKGVNEGGQSVSAEVSIANVVNPDDINIYRQLSGGVTAAQLLHGSANPIGGQSALIKLKWGSSPEEMLIPNAPKFIKCALGENVKQANWGDYNTIRFPQTRMGVEQVFYDAFSRAKKYEQEWNDFNSTKTEGKVAPRKDLELEVLLEILKSQRFITCHSYVQSEINMLMHMADSMGFRINTFTHILEGYKLADKMLKHGVGASTFSDWWAYKFEVNDAIPYNAKMMHDQGLVVAINSDDAEMGRRLNQEAAKGLKYGGMSEQDAWKMVTLNPAKLLHLDDRMGSIKVGKDADIVLWSDNPLSIRAKVEMTVVDGEILYDANRNADLQLRDQRERARIITKMLDASGAGEATKPFVKKKQGHFHCDTLGEEGTETENTH